MFSHLQCLKGILVMLLLTKIPLIFCILVMLLLTKIPLNEQLLTIAHFLKLSHVNYLKKIFLVGGDHSTAAGRRRRSGSKAGSLGGKSLKIMTEQKIKIAKSGMITTLFKATVGFGGSLVRLGSSLGVTQGG